MNELGIDADGDTIRLSGRLDFSTVPDAIGKLRVLIRPNAELALSLAGVDRANSAGLVLLLEAKQAAARARTRLRLEDLPESLVHLAGMCNLEPMLQD